MRCSRSAATCAWTFNPAVNWPTTKATTSITTNVTRYWTSLTANEKRGGTKKKSNKPTPTKAASTAGPRPQRKATTITASRKSITILLSSNTASKGVANTATAAHTRAAAP